MNIKAKSKITCPKCSFKKEEEIPSNACVYFWKCPECKETIKPIEGDCCVFCSYGNEKCSPKQMESNN